MQPKLPLLTLSKFKSDYVKKIKFGYEFEFAELVDEISPQIQSAITKIYGPKMVRIDPLSYNHDDKKKRHQYNKWNFIYEGMGSELITPILRLPDLKRVYQVCSILKKEVSFDRHCGFHIHISLAGITDSDKFAFTWLMFEPALTFLVHQSRYSNSCCKRLSKWARPDINAKPLVDYYDRISDCSRSHDTALSLRNYKINKTAEIRFLEGIIDKTDVRAWTDIILKLLLFSTKIDNIMEFVTGTYFVVDLGGLINTLDITEKHLLDWIFNRVGAC